LFRAFFEKTGAHKILALHSGNGGEYISNKFTAYLAQAGISHKPGPPHSPELNKVAERTNQTIGNLVRCSLLSANVPKSFWVDALRHIFFSFNSIPCHTPLGFKSPNSILVKPLVDLNYLHPFGCLVWYAFPAKTRKSLDKKAQLAILLSYLSDANGY
jgi:transposase InsO family protein